MSSSICRSRSSCCSPSTPAATPASSRLLDAVVRQGAVESFLVEALKNSLIIATTSALLAAIFGTVAALGLQRSACGHGPSSTRCSAPRSSFPASSSASRRWSHWSQLFAVVNPLLAALWPGRPAAAPGARLRLDDRRPRPVLDGAGGDDRRRAARQPGPQPGRGSSDLYATPLTHSARSCCR